MASSKGQSGSGEDVSLWRLGQEAMGLLTTKDDGFACDFVSHATHGLELPGLEIASIGAVSVPIDEALVKAARAKHGPLQPLSGEGSALFLYPSKFALRNPAWGERMREITGECLVDFGRGLGGTPCTAELSGLVLCGPGCAFDLAALPPPPAGAFAALEVLLPSSYTGGGVTVNHGSQSRAFAASFRGQYCLQRLAHFLGCQRSMTPLTSGCRASLLYYLIPSSIAATAAASAPAPIVSPIPEPTPHERLVATLQRMTGALRQGRAGPSRLCYILQQKYDVIKGQVPPLSALRGEDATVASRVARLLAQVPGAKAYLCRLRLRQACTAEEDLCETDYAVLSRWTPLRSDMGAGSNGRTSSDAAGSSSSSNASSSGCDGIAHSGSSGTSLPSEHLPWDDEESAASDFVVGPQAPQSFFHDNGALAVVTERECDKESSFGKHDEGAYLYYEAGAIVLALNRDRWTELTQSRGMAAALDCMIMQFSPPSSSATSSSASAGVDSPESLTSALTSLLSEWRRAPVMRAVRDKRSRRGDAGPSKVPLQRAGTPQLALQLLDWLQHTMRRPDLVQQLLRCCLHDVMAATGAQGLLQVLSSCGAEGWTTLSAAIEEAEARFDEEYDTVTASNITQQYESESGSRWPVASRSSSVPLLLECALSLLSTGQSAFSAARLGSSASLAPAAAAASSVAIGCTDGDTNAVTDVSPAIDIADLIASWVEISVTAACKDGGSPSTATAALRLLLLAHEYECVDTIKLCSLLSRLLTSAGPVIFIHPRLSGADNDGSDKPPAGVTHNCPLLAQLLQRADYAASLCDNVVAGLTAIDTPHEAVTHALTLANAIASSGSSSISLAGFTAGAASTSNTVLSFTRRLLCFALTEWRPIKPADSWLVQYDKEPQFLKDNLSAILRAAAGAGLIEETVEMQNLPLSLETSFIISTIPSASFDSHVAPVVLDSANDSDSNSAAAANDDDDIFRYGVSGIKGALDYAMRRLGPRIAETVLSVVVEAVRRGDVSVASCVRLLDGVRCAPGIYPVDVGASDDDAPLYSGSAAQAWPDRFVSALLEACGASSSPNSSSPSAADVSSPAASALRGCFMYRGRSKRDAFSEGPRWAGVPAPDADEGCFSADELAQLYTLFSSHRGPAQATSNGSSVLQRWLAHVAASPNCIPYRASAVMAALQQWLAALPAPAPHASTAASDSSAVDSAPKRRRLAVQCSDAAAAASLYAVAGAVLKFQRAQLLPLSAFQSYRYRRPPRCRHIKMSLFSTCHDLRSFLKDPDKATVTLYPESQRETGS